MQFWAAVLSFLVFFLLFVFSFSLCMCVCMDVYMDTSVHPSVDWATWNKCIISYIGVWHVCQKTCNWYLHCAVCMTKGGKGKLVVLGSCHVFSDQYIDKEENSKILVKFNYCVCTSHRCSSLMIPLSDTACEWFCEDPWFISVSYSWQPFHWIWDGGGTWLAGWVAQCWQTMACQIVRCFSLVLCRSVEHPAWVQPKSSPCQA